MNGINIAKAIIRKRKEKGITQDDLADFIGVSKSSVSKWETGQSFPDILYLPQLAAYFNISLDELMGYEPQMTSEDIRKLNNKLVKEFATKPFYEVMNRCRDLTKKYFSCFPLLFEIGVLYINNALTIKDDNQKVSTIIEAMEIFVRVKEQSNDIELKQLALHSEATCAMLLGKPSEIIDLLAGVKPPLPNKVILSQAYLMMGKTKEAKAELQQSIYFNTILSYLESVSTYIAICADEAERFDEIYKRTSVLIDTFNVKKLAPLSVLPFYLAAAQGYLTNGNLEKTLDMIETYTDIVTSDIYPLKMIKGDGFFDLIEDSANKMPFGLTDMPRDEKIIKQSMADAIIESPVFSTLSDETRYKRLVEILKNNIKGE